MATFTTTTKYLLRWLTGTNTISDIDAGFQALAEDIDARMAGYAEGTLAGRSGAGKAGRFYRTTDTGQVFMDTGAAWVEIGIAPWNPGDLKITWLTVAPAGWLLCDGQAVSRSTYAALFTAIGTSAGTGNGSTTFNVPDWRGRVFVMPDGSAGRLPDNDSRGYAAGAASVALTEAEMPVHDHEFDSPTTLWFEVGTGGPRGETSGNGPADFSTADIANAGGGQAHENRMPYLVGGAILIKT